MKIHFRLSHVLSVGIDDSFLDLPIPTENEHIDLRKPFTKVILANTQPVYIDPDMVGYVENDELRFEK